ncbi:hypothetical protein RJG79_06395 [Mycoplasmatota bacterium WC44]
MNLIKLHLSYLFNKKVAVILSVSILLLIIVLTLSTNFWVNAFNKQMYHNIYLNEYTNNVKFIYNIIIFVSIMMFNHSFDKSQDSYMVFIVTRDIKKRKYFIYKVITLVIFITLYTLLVITILYLISRLNGYFINELKYFSLIYIQAIIYGQLSLLFTQMINSSMTNVIIIMLYWMNEVLISLKIESIKYLHLLIPHVIQEKINFHYEVKYVIIYIVIIILLNTYLFVNKELN